MDAITGIGRRGFIGRTIGGIAALLGWKTGKAATPQTEASALLATITGPEARNDVTVTVRNLYANRNPLLARLAWMPIDEDKFDMFSLRFPTEAENNLIEAMGSPVGLMSVGVRQEQLCQRYEFLAEADKSDRLADVQVFPDGIRSPFGFNRAMQLQNMVDDIEKDLYYGVRRMKGLFHIIKTNQKMAPHNFEGYTFEQYILDTIDAAKASGGDPDVLIISSDMGDIFKDWGHPLVKVDGGQTVLGTPIRTYGIASLPGISIIEAPLLRSSTTITMTSSEVYIRNKVNPHWIDREGDPGSWAAEVAVDVVNEQHFGWLEAA